MVYTVYYNIRLWLPIPIFTLPLKKYGELSKDEHVSLL